MNLIRFTLFCLCLLQTTWSWAQLQAGPMVGYSDMKEVMLWAQTKQPARVQIRYWEQGKPTTKWSTAEVSTETRTALTAHLLADKVQPGKKYEYEVLVNGKKILLSYPTRFQSQTLWQWRTDPPPFRFGFGTCMYVNEPEVDRPGTPYGSNYGLLTSIAKQNPDFMLWGGDNTYLREVDWNSRTGVLHRYTHTRSLPELQPLLAAAHNYAIWDDHDFGPNDSDRGYWLKPVTLEAFKLFWANPNFIFDEGCTGTFHWNDCQFFLIDDRSFRSVNNATDDTERTLLGQRQFQWLLDALKFSQATFKFVVVGGQVINTAKVVENYANYSEERDRLLQAITQAKIPGVMFLTGDRHHTILHKLDRPGTYPLYDLTVSPLTSGISKPYPEDLSQPTYVNGTAVVDQNFGLLSVSGPLKDRVLTIKILDTSGNERWSREIKATDLR